MRERLAALPSVERMLHAAGAAGHVTAQGRSRWAGDLPVPCWTSSGGACWDGTIAQVPSLPTLVAEVAERLATPPPATLRAVFNLTGTVLHTNLGRAILPEVAIAAVADVARNPSTLEYDLERGERGERDSHCEGLICELTGGRGGHGRQQQRRRRAAGPEQPGPASRGDRPPVGNWSRSAARSASRMSCRAPARRCARSGRPIAPIPPTTPRPSPRGPAAIMRVHTSNYRIEGFTSAVADQELSRMAREAGIPVRRRCRKRKLGRLKPLWTARPSRRCGR